MKGKFLLYCFYTIALPAAFSLYTEAPLKEPSLQSQEEQPSIYLNFENATLSSIVNFLGKQKNINIVPHKNLETVKVSLSTQSPLTLEQAWNELLTMLEANQLTLIEVEGMYRVVPSNHAKAQPLPVFMHSPKELPENDMVVRYAYLFKNIKPDNVRMILDQMLLPGSVHYNTNLNACVITEKSINIKTVMNIIQELDSGGLRESIKIIHLKEANAEKVADFINRNLIGTQNEHNSLRLMQPLGKQESGYFSKNIKAIPDVYNNTLILLGTENGLQRIIDFVHRELDRPIEVTESRLHIKELKYTDAEKLKPILDAVIKPPSRDAKSPIVGQVKYFEDMIIAAESASTNKDDNKSVDVGSGNRLLISCSRDDWKRIEPFIDKYDKPKPQVALEVLFVNVNSTINHSLGAQLTTKRLNEFGKNITAETQHLAGLQPTGSPQNEMLVFGSPASGGNAANPNAEVLTSGSTFISAGKYPTLWAIAQAALGGSMTNVLSQPYLIASNHQKCSLEISENRVLSDRIDSSSTTAISKNANIPAVTSIEIIPTINSEGLITLSITAKLDSFTNAYTTPNASTSGNRSTNHIQTRATIADGEVLAIGGILRGQTTEKIEKTPILGDLPFIGSLFRKRTQTIQPSNLNIFIRPTLIKPSFEGGRDDYTQLKLDYSKLQIGRASDFLGTNDPIQRWFFNSNKKAEDFQQIDDFTEGKNEPSTVMIPIDPHYKTETSRTIQRLSRHRKKLLQKEKNSKPT